MRVRPDHDVRVLETWWKFRAGRWCDLQDRRPRLDTKRRSCNCQRTARRCVQGRSRESRPAQYRAGVAIDIGRARILRVARHSSGIRANARAFCGLYGYGKFAFTSRNLTNREGQAAAALYAVNDAVRRKSPAETGERQTRQAASDARILQVSGSVCQAKLI